MVEAKKKEEELENKMIFNPYSHIYLRKVELFVYDRIKQAIFDLYKDKHFDSFEKTPLMRHIDKRFGHDRPFLKGSTTEKYSRRVVTPKSIVTILNIICATKDNRLHTRRKHRARIIFIASKWKEEFDNMIKNQGGD